MKQLSALVKAHPYLTTYLFVYALLGLFLIFHFFFPYPAASSAAILNACAAC